MKRVKYIIFSLLIGILFIDGVSAASASLLGNGTVTLGNSTTLTSKISSNDAIFFIEGTLSCSGAGVDKSIDLSFDNMDNSVKSNSKSMTMKPTTTGEIRCSLNAKVIDASSSSWVSVSNSGTIKVVKPREKSTNNNLKDLSVEGYELSPSFSKDTLEYTVNIDKNVEKIKINTKLEDGYARVSGNGEQEVFEGSNKFEIVVTSETGSKKTYTLNVNVKDNNPIIKKVDGKEYSVVKRAKSLTLPDVLDKDLFNLSNIKIDDVDIPVYISSELNLTLIGLKDDKGNTYLFKMVNEEIKEKYEILSSNKLNILFTSPEKVKDGYTKTNITIDGKDYTAYKNEDTILIYGTNIDTDLSNWYRYDEKEKTIQIYDSSDVDKLNAKEKEFNNTLEEYKIIILGLACLAVLLIVIIVILLVSKSKLKNRVNKVNVKKEEIKKEEKKVVREESVKKEKVNKKEEIATKVEEEKKDKHEEKEQAKEEIAKVEEELKQEENKKDEEIIPSVEEIEEDLKEVKKEKIKEKSVEEEDELMDPYDFLDIKRKRKK